jgi:NitT/TauT family transport system substrate-binding protein
MYGAKFVNEKSEVARRFTIGYVRGIRDYLDAFTKDKDKEAIIGILIAATTLKDRALYDKIGLAGLDPDGRVNVKDLDLQQDFYVRTGTMAKRIDINKAVDNTFVDNALAQLGPYQ